jgi:8-oxo-dGTP pyrophosphatase MutT (NUDIX family)
MIWKPVKPEDAATVVLTRDSSDGLEVYMTRRQPSLLFLGGYHVFPGGKLDDADRSPEIFARCRDCDLEEAARQIEGVDDPDRAAGLMVAAIRELFEEAGVLLGEDEAGRPLANPSKQTLNQLADLRKKLQADEIPFSDLLEMQGLYCSLSRLKWFAHWITPATSPRRFNTFFFVARKPKGQETSRFEQEIDEAVWVKPREAIERWKAGEWLMIPPTIASLDTLSRYESWEAIKADFGRPPAEHQRTVWKGL